MVNSQNVASNTYFFMAALVVQKVLSFVYFTILARNLGAENIGQYFFAISFATIFSVLIDLGLASVLIREVARQTEEWQKWFSQFLTLKLILALLTAVVLFILNYTLFHSDEVHKYVNITTFIVIIDSFTLLFYAFIRGRQNLRYEALGTLLFQFIVMVLGISAIKYTHSVAVFLTILFIASLFNFVYAAVILNKKYLVKFQLLFSTELIKKIVGITLPFALAAIFAKVYAYIDTVFLKMFLGDAEVGFYSVAYKLTFAFQFIPLAFVAALYPAFSRFFKTDLDQLGKLFFRSFNYLGFIALPLCVVIIVLADPLIHQVYTAEFTSSVIPLQILIASIPFLFLNFTLSSLLNACEKQKINTINLGLVMVLNVILNLSLIPVIGIWGASMASSISTVCLFLLNWRAVRGQIKSQTPISASLFKPLVKAVGSAMIMAIAIKVLSVYLHWILAALLGLIVYFMLMLLMKAITKADLIFLKSIALRK